MLLKKSLYILSSFLFLVGLVSCGGRQEIQPLANKKAEPKAPSSPASDSVKGYWTGANDIYLKYTYVDGDNVERTQKLSLLQLPKKGVAPVNPFFSVVAENGQAAFLVGKKGNLLINSVWEDELAYLVLGQVNGLSLTGTAYDMTRYEAGEQKIISIANLGQMQIPMDKEIPLNMQFEPIDVKKLDENGDVVQENGEDVYVKDYEFKEYTNLSYRNFFNTYSLFADKVARLTHKNVMNDEGTAVKTAAVIKNAKLEADQVYKCWAYTDGKTLKGSNDSIGSKINFTVDSSLNLNHSYVNSAFPRHADCSINISTTVISETSAESADKADSQPSQYSVKGIVSSCYYGINVTEYEKNRPEADDYSGIAVVHAGGLNVYMASPSLKTPLVLTCNK